MPARQQRLCCKEQAQQQSFLVLSASFVWTFSPLSLHGRWWSLSYARLCIFGRAAANVLGSGVSFYSCSVFPLLPLLHTAMLTAFSSAYQPGGVVFWCFFFWWVEFLFWFGFVCVMDFGVSLVVFVWGLFCLYFCCCCYIHLPEIVLLEQLPWWLGWSKEQELCG